MLKLTCSFQPPLFVGEGLYLKCSAFFSLKVSILEESNSIAFQKQSTFTVWLFLIFTSFIETNVIQLQRQADDDRATQFFVSIYCLDLKLVPATLELLYMYTSLPFFYLLKKKYILFCFKFATFILFMIEVNAILIWM